MTGNQSRLGDITDEAARALELVDRITAGRQADWEFWPAMLKRVILDLDEVGLGREVTRIADLLAVAWGRLEDKPDETKGASE